MSIMTNFDEYFNRVKEQLYCNASDDYKAENITYTFTEEQVMNNVEYFVRCMNDGLSPYKALLFFGDYLSGYFDGNIY